MSEYDLHSNVKDEVALVNQDITTNTTTNGAIIDTVGFESIEFVIQSGAIAAGTYTLVLEEDDVIGFGSATVVPADQTLGVLTGFVAADDDDTKRVGSIGKKRFQRLSILSAGVSGSNLFSAIAMLGHPKTSPTAE